MNGVTRVFCVPGESYLAVLDAPVDVRDKSEVVTCQHEAAAANMAEDIAPNRTITSLRGNKAVMRALCVLITVAALLAACATPSEAPGVTRSNDPASCAIVAVVAHAQYEFSELNPMPLDRNGYAPRCDWSSLALKVDILDYEGLPTTFSPLVTFERPQRRGDQASVVTRFWNGVHLTTRTCRLERTGVDWRLVEECTVTAFF